MSKADVCSGFSIVVEWICGAILAGLVIFRWFFAIHLSGSAPSLTFVSLLIIFGSLAGGLFFASGSSFFYTGRFAALICYIKAWNCLLVGDEKFYIARSGRRLLTLLWTWLRFFRIADLLLSFNFGQQITLWDRFFLSLLDELHLDPLLACGAILLSVFGVRWFLLPDSYVQK